MDSGLESGSTEDYETDVKLLKSAWRQEKATPEVLQFESALIRRIIEQIQLMEETVEEFTESGIDPLTVSLYQMDLDRTQFLLISYYRIRLQKVQLTGFNSPYDSASQRPLDEPFEMEPNVLYFVRYKAVKKFKIDLY
ncbi:hypothetical protein C1H46_011205 [Malus baccata]|uniref:DNA replication complex GINS protein SLD5 n=1 Tax=Malus baccata TaxID=106549 RepID=A0A540MWN5_MALBA|nr:hypothetical protein C1H46_011205 [Malus baccata]